MHAQGFKVVPWTANHKEQWNALIEMGVEGIITDYPRDLVCFLKEKYVSQNFEEEGSSP